MLWMEKNKGLIFVMFHVLCICVPGVMKIGENWSIWFLWSFVHPASWKLEKIKAFEFLWSFVYPGSWKSEKIEGFNFWEVSCTQKIQILQFSPIFMTPVTQNSNSLIFSDFHETAQKSNASIFSNFHEPGYKKLLKNQMLQRNFTKIKCNNFLWFSWPRVHKIQILPFSPIFMSPGTRNFSKIICFNFLEFSWPWVHKIDKIQILQFSPIFMSPGTQNFTKIKCFNFLQFSWPRVHKINKIQILQFSLIFMTPGTQN